MNSSIVVQSSGIHPTQSNVRTAFTASNAQDSASVLVRLEEKYGNRKLRLDGGHQLQPRPHFRAQHFKDYTAWLSSHVNRPDPVLQPNTSSPALPVATEQNDTPVPSDSIAYADPGILATVDPLLLTNSIDTSQTAPVNLNSTMPLERNVDLSIPVDVSGFSIETLKRVDDAHSSHSLNRVPHHGKSKNIPAAHFPSAPASWEVTDFSWPSIINKIEQAETQAAGNLADAAIQVLGTSDQRLAVIGSGRGPGTTTIAMYLSKILASRKKRVLLIDADLSKPDLTHKLGIPTELSWLNAIEGKYRASHSIIRSITTGICVMPVQKMANQVGWPRFVYDCLGEIIDKVRPSFDFVLIDIGPASQIIRELSQPNLLVDAAMLVHNVRLPDHSMFVSNQNELSSFGIKRLVVAENFYTEAH